ncbi:MAG: hypothetical protein V7606_2216, partial [Burkholderiales bacterium]
FLANVLLVVAIARYGSSSRLAPHPATAAKLPNLSLRGALSDIEEFISARFPPDVVSCNSLSIALMHRQEQPRFRQHNAPHPLHEFFVAPKPVAIAGEFNLPAR